MRAAVSHPTARLSAFYAAAFLVTGVQLPFWPVWLSARGLDAREIGLLLAAAIWTKVIATPAIGALADRSGRRRSVMLGLAAAALAAYLYLGLSAAAGFLMLLAPNLVALTAQSALMPLGNAATLAASRRHGLDYGRIRVWGSVGFILASLGGGAVLAGRAAAAVLPLVIAGSAIVLLACLGVPAAHRSTGARNPHPKLWRLLRNKRFWLFLATASALQASHQVYYGFGTIYWRSLGFPQTAIGWLWAEGVAAEIVLFWQGRRLLARLGPSGLLALGGAAGVVRWGFAGFVPSLPAAAALQVLHAFTFGASHLGAMHFLSRTVPGHSAAGAQSLYAALSSGFGGGLVMLAAGALYASWGGRAYLFMAVLSAAGLAGAIALRPPHVGERGPVR